MKYWHKVCNAEAVNVLIGSPNIRTALLNFAQPEWCDYPEATHPTFGCRYLTDLKYRAHIGEKICGECHMNKWREKNL